MVMVMCRRGLIRSFEGSNVRLGEYIVVRVYSIMCDLLVQSEFLNWRSCFLAKKCVRRNPMNEIGTSEGVKE